MAVESGADLIGVIFYPPSPRSVTPQQAQATVRAVRRAPANVECIGLFVDKGLEAIRRVAADCDLTGVQLHGREPPRLVTVLLEEGLLALKAFRLRGEACLAMLAHYQPTAYLLDAYVPGRPGGTGQTFDWEWACRAKRHGPVVLAGGLTPENVGEAVRVVRPWGVDVASGVESAPGRKDPGKVRRFVAEAKRAGGEATG